MEKKYIVIDGIKIYHGDKISATINYMEDDEYKVEDARLCINNLEVNSNGDITELYICQNDANGDDNAEEKFGYKYSWVFRINKEGKLTSSDTYIIKSKELYIEADDDDPMPEDWVCEEKFPDDI